MFNPQLDIAVFMSCLAKKTRIHRGNSQGADKKE